jgi:predicted ferric reductase
VTTWIVLRAAGIGAYLMLFLSVSWGLIATTGALGRRVSKASATTVHQFMGTCGLFLLAIHIAGLLIDTFMPFHPMDVLVPMHGTFKPIPVAFGIGAMYASVFVIVASWLRKRLGTKWWRRTHLLAVPAFTIALVHGVFAGTDTVRPWMWSTYLITGSLVLFLVILRGLTAGVRPVRAARPAHATPVARRAAAVRDLDAELKELEAEQAALAARALREPAST